MKKMLFLSLVVMICLLQPAKTQEFSNHRKSVLLPEATAGVNDFYNYIYDGGDSCIDDGGNDLYDIGNQVFFIVDGIRNSSNYDTKADGDGFTFASYTSYPFLAYFNISTTDERFRNFSIQVTSNLGADGYGTLASDSGSVQIDGLLLRYNAVQSYGTSESTVCEVYFTIHTTYNGAEPTSSLSILNNDTAEWNNRYDVYGSFQRSIVGYTLLSKYSGARVEKTEINAVMKKLLAFFQNGAKNPAVLYDDFTDVLRERLIRNLSLVASTVNNFHYYVYDDATLYQIRDGNGDMYDRGNRIAFQNSGLARYNATYSGDGYSFTTVAKNPFTAFLYIYGTKWVEAVMEVESDLGTDGYGVFEHVEGFVSFLSYHVRYNGTQVFGTRDSSVCEIYFAFDLKESFPPYFVDFDLEVFLNDLAWTRNRVQLATSRKVILGYTLLSKIAGEKLTSEDIESALLKLLEIFVGPADTRPETPGASFNCTSQSVEVSFTENYVRSVVPEGDVSVVFLDQDSKAMEPGCPSRYEVGTYIAESHYGMCAAERRESDEEIVERYKILLSSSSDNDRKLISYDFEKTVIDFECHFPTDAIVTLGRALVPAISLMHVDMGSQHAEFTVKMARYTSSSFTTISTDSAVLQGSTIYIALTLEGTSGMVLQGNDCNVSALEDGSGPVSLPLLINGCPDIGPDTLGVQLHPQEFQDIFGFSFPAFMWRVTSDEGQNLWITCTATVCTEEPGSCLEICGSFAKRRRSINVDEKLEESTKLSLGPFDFQTAGCDKDFLECSHQCTANQKGNAVCSCPPGYLLLGDGKTCFEDRLYFHEDSAVMFGLIFIIMLFMGSIWLARQQVKSQSMLTL